MSTHIFNMRYDFFMGMDIIFYGDGYFFMGMDIVFYGDGYYF